ncbi:leucine Rich Repeat family protein [Loa loa]|uniref:Leucine Rich Repeat family protein n=1 Tax=Loa loa TaxID=7209 RepID=A0A1I7W072_LOALO|nr:leucine Rich Repeat family protein [Loa loa]EFO22296.2 leucine Rich Repeat family protein [Loa loa]
MSLSRGVHAELCSYVQEKCNSIFGSKFWDCRLACSVEYGTKTDKFENRIFALSKFRVFILHGKTPSSLKIDRTFHILSIRVIQIVNDNEVCFGLDESFLGKRRIFIRLENGSKKIALSVLSALKHYFPDIIQNLRNLLELFPADLYDEFWFLPSSRPYLPCHNFRRSYAAVCDYYDQPFRDEVVWDVEKIYATHGIHILRLDDFTHLLPRDLLPIVAVCQYSCYFTGLCIDDVKLGSDLVDIILSIVRNSRSLKVLILRSCALPKDFIASFSNALQSNTPSLEEIDFSKNVLDDKKGFIALSSLLSKLTSLHSLTLSECAMTEKSVNQICYGILQGIKSNTDCKFLATLDFSGNNLKDDISDLLQLLSLCISLRVLNLSGTGINIDKLWASLIYGGLQLEILKLAGCQAGRRSKESAQQMKEYFSTAVALKELDFSNTTLNADILKALLLGLASNQQLKPFTLCLNGVCDRSSVSVLETCLIGVDVCTLSLKDNNLDSELLPVVLATSQMRHLTKLDLSGVNFPNCKRGTKNTTVVSNILLEIVKLVGEDDSKLNELSIADCRLGSHLSILLNTLGVACSLYYLDISGNEMGNFGARLLAKALQINTSLKTVLIDKNQITGDGYVDIAHSLILNSTLLSLPFPVIDAADSLNRADRAKTLAALTEIEACIEKNRAGFSHSEKQYICSVIASKQEIESCDVGNSGIGFEELKRSMNAIDLSEQLDIELEKVAYDVMSSLDDALLSNVKQALHPVMEAAEKEGLSEHALAKKHNSLARAALMNNIISYLCKTKWKLISETVQGIANDYRVQRNNMEKDDIGLQNGVDGSPRINVSNSTKSDAVRSHRPKSVVSEFSNDEIGEKVNLDAPPMPSALNHPSKCRPRPMRNFKRIKPQILLEETHQSYSESENGENSAVYDTAADEPIICSPGESEVDAHSSNLSISDGYRSRSPAVTRSFAPLPLSQDNFMSAGSGAVQRSASPLPPPTSASATVAPPIVPRRNKAGAHLVPPTLPPKPDQIVAVRPVSCTVDGDNRSGRKSVADMARLFSSTDAPFSRRS